MSIATEMTAGITAGLENALNTALRLDPETFKRLDSFSGKVIAIELRGFNLNLYLIPGSDGIGLMTQYAGTPDTVLSGTPLALARMALGPNASQVLFAGEVTIHGDVETGQRFKRLLDDLDIDWEEHLSRITGDITAHKLGDLLRTTIAWSQQAINQLGQNTAEYWQQEARDLPTPQSVNQYMEEIDRLRDDVARLDARITRLHQKSVEGQETREK